MAKVDDLREKFKELDVSMFDILNSLDTTPTKKYLETFCKVVGDYYRTSFPLESTDIKERTEYGLVKFLKKSMVSNKKNELLSFLSMFIEFNEKGSIPVNDVQKYSTFNQIEEVVVIAEEKRKEEELTKQFTKYFENEEWLILQPHNLKCSQKYGKSTKWCTTMNVERFNQYTTGNNVLVYVLNKLHDSKKVAIQRSSLNEEPNFWDSTDKIRSVFYLTKNNILSPDIISQILTIFDNVKPLKSIDISKNYDQTVEFSNVFEDIDYYDDDVNYDRIYAENQIIPKTLREYADQRDVYYERSAYEDTYGNRIRDYDWVKKSNKNKINTLFGKDLPF